MPRRGLSLFEDRQLRFPGPSEDHNLLVRVLNRPRAISEFRSEPISAGLRRHCQPTYSCRGAGRSQSILLFRRRRAGVLAGGRIRTALFRPCPVRERRCQSPACSRPRRSDDTLASSATIGQCPPKRCDLSCLLTLPSSKPVTTYRPWI
jgi:hypothetical protein